MAEKKSAKSGTRGRKAAARAPKRAARAPRQPQAVAPQERRLTLSSLSPAAGSTPSRKRVGRGPGSGLGKTSG